MGKHCNINIDGDLAQVESFDVTSVSTYLNKICKLIDVRRKEGQIYLYRGESRSYETACRANIFRKNVLSSNKLFEKSLFDTMRQNKLSGDQNYLENAIDAQHGEFPSRLLDVSYNSLCALYFAVTPYYHEKPDKYDKENGMVYVFIVDTVYSPSGENINNNYDAIIARKYDWLNDCVIFEKNHKFIDHTKINNRIVAQQGAFILFQGNDAANMPAYWNYGIQIKGEHKSKIRDELRLLFGIHTGSIYPEIVNLVNDLSDKSQILCTDEFNCENELRLVIANLRKELEYHYGHIVHVYSKDRDNAYFATLALEKTINSYKIGLLDFYEKLILNEGASWEVSKALFEEIIFDYNQEIDLFYKVLSENTSLEFSSKGLKIKVG